MNSALPSCLRRCGVINIWGARVPCVTMSSVIKLMSPRPHAWWNRIPRPWSPTLPPGSAPTAVAMTTLTIHHATFPLPTLPLLPPLPVLPPRPSPRPGSLNSCSLLRLPLPTRLPLPRPRQCSDCVQTVVVMTTLSTHPATSHQCPLPLVHPLNSRRWSGRLPSLLLRPNLPPSIAGSDSANPQLLRSAPPRSSLPWSMTGLDPARSGLLRPTLPCQTAPSLRVPTAGVTMTLNIHLATFPPPPPPPPPPSIGYLPASPILPRAGLAPPLALPPLLPPPLQPAQSLALLHRVRPRVRSCMLPRSPRTRALSWPQSSSCPPGDSPLDTPDSLWDIGR